MNWLYISGFIIAVVLAFILTPLVKKLAFKIGAVDKPNHRKVHTRPMPRLGGLAIYFAFVGTYFALLPFLPALKSSALQAILVGGSIIVLIGALDDRFDLSARVKLIGQIVAAGVVAIFFGQRIEFINVPFGSVIDWHQLEWLAVALTIFWIVGVTNAINLIDGLDGLAAGVSGIATATMLVIAVIMGNATVILISAILLGCIIGFLFFNFHPAKIFMGDSGALFLGFTLATLSLLGFKSVTLVSFVIPLFILGVPLSDTFLAIVRRIVNKKPISVADKSHLHHCLLQLGFSHRQTVLIIYGVALLFSLCAVLSVMTMSRNLNWVTVLITIALLIVLELGAESIGIISKGKKPLLGLLRRLQGKTAEFFR